MTPSDFLILLWGERPPDGLLVQIWQLQGRRSHYLRAPAAADGYTGADTYTGVALAHKDHGRHRRCPATEAAAIAGMWADIDVDGGPEHKTGAAPDVDAAKQLAHAVLEPTLIVHSGYGTQAWWLLDEPWRFADRTEQHRAARMSAQWTALHRAAAAARGFQLDSTHDLARLMRLPGTTNAKGGQSRPVTVLSADGPRYSLATLAATAEDAGDVPLHNTVAGNQDGALPDIIVHSAVEISQLLGALLRNSTEFADTWHHRRRGNARSWSLSEYDLSLCSQAAIAGCTDQQLADLLVAHRAHWDPEGTKQTRVDYVRRTISRARDQGEQHTAIARLRSLAHPERTAA